MTFVVWGCIAAICGYIAFSPNINARIRRRVDTKTVARRGDLETLDDNRWRLTTPMGASVLSRMPHDRSTTGQWLVVSNWRDQHGRTEVVLRGRQGGPTMSLEWAAETTLSRADVAQAFIRARKGLKRDTP